jgi:hypothetical protein
MMTATKPDSRTRPMTMNDPVVSVVFECGCGRTFNAFVPRSKYEESVTAIAASHSWKVKALPFDFSNHVSAECWKCNDNKNGNT